MTDIIGVGLERVGEQMERAVLVGTERLVGEGLRSMQELADLARAAGAIPVGMMIQKRDQPHQNTYLGKGKIEELKVLAKELDAPVILFDGDLSPRQVRTLVDRLEGKILDRTELILDIFAQHARTAEGQLQVELAQLSYLLPRLTGRGRMMDRIGGGAAGGVGVRGPGETKLETDRRRLRARIARLRREVEEVRRRRETERSHRRQGGVPLVSLVGYTNAGKSTLLNALAGSNEVSAHDRLFETLDPTVRKVTMGDQEVLVSDTVGFIHDLPEQLVEAFQATLEEVLESDLLVHVVDASAEYATSERQYTEVTLRELGAGAQPMVLALNKWDLVDPQRAEAVQEQIPEGIPISATTGAGLAELRETILAMVFHHRIPVVAHLPYDRGDLLNAAHRLGQVLDVSYEETYIRVELEVDDVLLDRLREFVVSE
jgi:GTPase